MRIYLFMATAIIGFLALAGVISLQTAMFSSFCMGAIAVCTIWTLVQYRKAWLLNIKEPEMRQKALTAMHDYIREVHGVNAEPRESFAAQQDRSEQCVDCGWP